MASMPLHWLLSLDRRLLPFPVRRAKLEQMVTDLHSSAILTSYLVAEISCHSRVTNMEEKLPFLVTVMGLPGKC
jgi:hypothetical protein